MADKFINETGLQAIKQWLKATFATGSDLSDLSDRVDEIVEEGAEPNIIDTVKVNGTALVPDAAKAVDVIVPTKTSDLTNDGDGSSNFATENYVDLNGGKIDVIKVNGTAQTITNKEVNLIVPTKTSDILNDSDYQTADEVQALIDDELSGITGIDYQIVDSLPASGEHGVIYLVHKGGSADDIYDEFIWVSPTGGTAHYEQIGTTAVDLSDYWSKTELQAMTVSEINEILNA